MQAMLDDLDEHILPAIFTSCVKEPSAGCAAVKLSLICIGALGMYWTRSLYGDRKFGTTIQNVEGRRTDGVFITGVDNGRKQEVEAALADVRAATRGASEAPSASARPRRRRRRRRRRRP